MRIRIGIGLLLGIGLMVSTWPGTPTFCSVQADEAPEVGAHSPTARPGGPDPKVNCKPRFREVVLEGRAVRFSQAMKEKLGVEWVDERAGDLLAFETTDGRLWALFPNEAARFFYNDERVRNRPMRVTGRIYDDAPGLVTLSFLSLVDGKPNEIYYWCNVCAIKSFADADCACCQGPVELREHPVGETHRYRDSERPNSAARESASGGGNPTAEIHAGEQ